MAASRLSPCPTTSSRARRSPRRRHQRSRRHRRRALARSSSSCPRPLAPTLGKGESLLDHGRRDFEHRLSNRSLAMWPPPPAPRTCGCGSRTEAREPRRGDEGNSTGLQPPTMWAANIPRAATPSGRPSDAACPKGRCARLHRHARPDQGRLSRHNRGGALHRPVPGSWMRAYSACGCGYGRLLCGTPASGDVRPMSSMMPAELSRATRGAEAVQRRRVLALIARLPLELQREIAGEIDAGLLAQAQEQRARGGEGIA